MAISIAMPLGLDDLDKVFQVVDLLDNKESLLKEFYPEISKFLVKKDFFTGHTKRLYQEAFDELVISLIKKQLIKHFNYTPEEILLLTDHDFLKMIAAEYFETENYKLPKDGIQ